MDLHSLISKLEAIESSTVDEGCGDPMPSMPAKPEPPAPSMSVNLNAQGMDNIEDMIGLMKKLGGVDKPEMPAMDKPMIAPLKMLPKSNDKPMIAMDSLEEGQADGMLMKLGQDPKYFPGAKIDPTEQDGVYELLASNGEHVANIHMNDDGGAFIELANGDDYELSDEENAEQTLQTMYAEINGMEEAYENEPNEEYDDVDYILNTLAGGMNRPKGTHSNVSKGDNPMQKIAKHESEEMDLRSQIKEELAQRLAQYKGN